MMLVIVGKEVQQAPDVDDTVEKHVCEPELTKEQFHLICIHEAGHAVTASREGILEGVEVFIAPAGYEHETAKYTYYTSTPSPMVTCAGHYADVRFADAPDDIIVTGSELDFLQLKKQHPNRSWPETLRALHERYDSDTLFESQVRVVAAACRKTTWLNHDAVVEIMDGVCAPACDHRNCKERQQIGATGSSGETRTEVNAE